MHLTTSFWCTPGNFPSSGVLREDKASYPGIDIGLARDSELGEKRDQKAIDTADQRNLRVDSQARRRLHTIQDLRREIIASQYKQDDTALALNRDGIKITAFGIENLDDAYRKLEDLKKLRQSLKRQHLQ